MMMTSLLAIVWFAQIHLSDCFTCIGAAYANILNRNHFASTATTTYSSQEYFTDSHWPSFRNKNMSYFQASFNELDNLRVTRKGKQKILGRIISWVLSKIIVSRSEYVTGLELNIWSQRNLDILRGKIDAMEMKFDKICFCKIFVSGGGRFLIKGLNLRMRRFLFQKLQSVRIPYIIYCDLIFTQLDIVKSTFIKNLIQLLVDTILERVLSQAKTVGVDTSRIVSAQINSVKIDSRRIHAIGVARILSNSTGSVGAAGFASIDFEISTGAGMRDEGQTLYLRDIKVLLNPRSFLRTDIPILTVSPIDVDLGEEFRIESLVIANKNIWIRAASVISPVEPFSVIERRSKALFKYDVSGMLSTLLRLNGGIAMRWT